MPVSFQKPPEDFGETLFWHPYSLSVILNLPPKHDKNGEKKQTKTWTRYWRNTSTRYWLKTPKSWTRYWLYNRYGNMYKRMIFGVRGCRKGLHARVGRFASEHESESPCLHLQRLHLFCSRSNAPGSTAALAWGMRHFEIDIDISIPYRQALREWTPINQRFMLSSDCATASQPQALASFWLANKIARNLRSERQIYPCGGIATASISLSHKSCNVLPGRNHSTYFQEEWLCPGKLIAYSNP